MKNLIKVLLIQNFIYLALVIFYPKSVLTLALISSLNSKKSNLIKVGSYNVKRQENLIDLNKDFETLKSIPILGLQEVQFDSRLKPSIEFSLEPITKRYWPHQCFYKTNQDSNHLWEGQVILSQYPIIKCGQIMLDSTDIKKRIALWAVIEISAYQKILFINTDHETNSSLTLGFPDRKKQILSLVDAIKNCDQIIDIDCLNWSKVIVGDFNTLEISLTSPFSTYNEIYKTEVLMESYNFDRIKPCENNKVTFSSWLGNFELDHIFTQKIKNTSCRYSDYNFLASDHYPVWSWINF